MFLYHSSWRTSSSCFRDVGGGNLFLTLVSKTDQSGLIMFKCGDCAGQGRCWTSPSCYLNHDWTVPAVRMGSLSSWKPVSLHGNNVWIMGCTWLPNLSTYSLAVAQRKDMLKITEILRQYRVTDLAGIQVCTNRSQSLTGIHNGFKAYIKHLTLQPHSATVSFINTLCLLRHFH
jgi:hypothetical protein